MSRAWSALAAALAVIASSGSARADNEAREHYRKGRAALDRGATREGIDELWTAYGNFPQPNFLYFIARAHKDAGDAARAIAAFRRYLETGPADWAEVEQIVVLLEAELRAQEAALVRAWEAGFLVAPLDVETEPPGATLREGAADGRELCAKTPCRALRTWPVARVDLNPLAIARRVFQRGDAQSETRIVAVLADCTASHAECVAAVTVKGSEPFLHIVFDGARARRPK